MCDGRYMIAEYRNGAYQIMNVTEINENEIQKVMSGNSLIEFFSPDCGYCRLSEPVIRRLSEEYTDVKFFKIDAHKSESIAKQYNISGLPTFVLFSDGDEVGRSAGARGESVLRELLDKVFAESEKL